MYSTDRRDRGAGLGFGLQPSIASPPRRILSTTHMFAFRLSRNCNRCILFRESSRNILGLSITRASLTCRSRTVSCSFATPIYRNLSAFAQLQQNSIDLLEEETLPNYDPDEFYPIHIGDKLCHRYQVIGKLGYGSNSTVWFGRDLQ